MQTLDSEELQGGRTCLATRDPRRRLRVRFGELRSCSRKVPRLRIEVKIDHLRPRVQTRNKSSAAEAAMLFTLGAAKISVFLRVFLWRLLVTSDIVEIHGIIMACCHRCTVFRE